MTRRSPRVERSAGGVVLRRIRGRVHVLLIQDPYRNWGLPKGHVEAGEAILDTALREVREETGLTRLIPGPEVKTIDWIFRVRGRRVHKFCSFYLMVSPEGRTRPERAEGISQCRWVRLDEADEHISYDNAREVVVVAREMVTGTAPSPVTV